MQTYPCWHCKEKDQRIEALRLTLRQYLNNADARMVRGFNFNTGEYPVTAETISILCAEKQKLQAKLDAVINAVYDGCDCDCRGNVNKALKQAQEDE